MSRRRCAAVVALVIFGSTLEFGAEEKPGTAGAPESVVEPEAIAAAKKDFDAVKASNTAALQRPADAPRVSILEWHGAAAVPNLKRAPSAPTPETKSATWLIDAMEKRPNTRDSRAVLERAHGTERPGNLREEQAESSSPSETRRLNELKDKNDPKRAGGPEVVNPLARHLSDWMTPADYTLLKPGLTQSLGSTTSKPTQAFGGIGTSINSLLSSGADAGQGVLSPLQPNVASRVPRENPYLATLTPTAPIPPLVSIAKPGTLPPPPAAAIPTLMLPSASPASPPKIPEFAKPPTDEKYFKQLKRF